MKIIKMLSTVLTVCMLFGFAATAESIDIPTETAAPETPALQFSGGNLRTEMSHVTVGNSTRVSGMFFTNQFGNNTSDIDVRAMIHGYDPIVWESQLTFIIDETVVTDYSKSTNGAGDTVYTFTINDKLLWNDGTPVTAADYAFAYALEASDQFQKIGGSSDVYQHIKGYDEFVKGQSKKRYRDLYDVEIFSGVRLLGTYTYSVTVQKEYLPYFYELSFLSIDPCPISVIAPGCEVADDGQGVYIRNIDENLPERLFTAELLEQTILDGETGYLSHPMLTCGPYNLTSYDSSTGVVEFHINEYYNGNYRGIKPVITDITLVQVMPQDMVQKLQDGEVDVLNKVVDGEIIRDLMQLQRGELPESYIIPDGVDEEDIDVRAIEMQNYARLGYGFLGVSCEQGPQQFVKVRQAIACCVDSEEFVRSCLMGFGLSVKGYYGLGQWMTQAAIGNLRPEEMTEEEVEIWDSFSLDGLDDYYYDLDRALSLLISDGWVLNEDGEPFDARIDTLRYKRIDENTLMPLSFKFGLTERNEVAQEILKGLNEAIIQLNGEIIVEEAPYIEILEDYTREEGTARFDLIFMATNFVSVFDPLVDITSKQEYRGSQNASAIFDEQLEALAWKLHETTPLDVQSFEENWIEYQTRYNEILPTIPIYSNVYFDFYSNWLRDYGISSEANWPTAILYAGWSEPEEIIPTETEEPEFEDEDDGDDITIDDM